MRTLTSIITLLTSLIVQLSYGQIKSNWGFKKELISYMQSPSDTIYIQDRKILEKIGGLKCTDTTVTFNYTTKSGDKVFISIKNSIFVPAKHTIYLSDTVFKFIHNEKRVDYLIEKNLIDGRPAYGNNTNYPQVEIEKIKIRWNDTWLIIPDSAFHNLYETHLCLDYLPVESYVTNNGKLLYVYIYASDGAGSYAVKLIFNRNKYLTRIVNTNECSIGFDFLDANANCE